jgi:transposase InsO family protein
MKEHNLLVKPNARLKAIRSNQAYKNKPRATMSNQYWGIDMTKVMIIDYGWQYLTIVKDWYSKKLIGYSLSGHSKTDDWLKALNTACNTQFPNGILSKEHELFLVSDNGSQPTSRKFMQACSVMEIKQIFTSYNNPKGNAETERLIRTIKEDLIWIKEFSSPAEFEDALKQWINDYNTDYPHSALNYKTPDQFEKEQLQLTKT